MLEIMDHLGQEVQFPTEGTEDFNDRKIHTLDFKFWLTNKNDKDLTQGGGTGDFFMYEYFEKEQGTEYCILNNSAMDYNSKRASLSQEVIRILSNIHYKLPLEVKVSHINKFHMKLEHSG